MLCGPVTLDELRGIADGDCAGQDWDDLVNRVDLGAELHKIADSLQASGLGEIDRLGLSSVHDGHKTVQWASNRTGVCTATISRLLKCEQKLAKSLPEIHAKWRDREMTTEQAAVFANAVNDRNEDTLAAMQDKLLDVLHAATTFEKFRANIVSIGKLFDPDGAHKDDPDASWAKVDALGDGVSISGHFTGPGAEVVNEAIMKAWEIQFRKAQEDRKQTPDLAMPTVAELKGRAIEDICARYTGNEKARKWPEVSFLARTGTEPSDGTDGPATTKLRVYRKADGKQLTPEEYDVFLCDMNAAFMLTDIHGAVERLTHEHRNIPDAIRKALHLRDGGCIFPGCDAPAHWTDAHHVQHWEHDGPTEMWNLACLCRRHHGVVHRTDWRMIPLGNQRWGLITPSGDLIVCQRHGKEVDVSDLDLDAIVRQHQHAPPWRQPCP